jgi:hypothetical protein
MNNRTDFIHVGSNVWSVDEIVIVVEVGMLGELRKYKPWTLSTLDSKRADNAATNAWITPFHYSTTQALPC